MARETAAWWVAFYLTSMGPLYAGTLERFGYGSEVAAVLSANPSRSTPVVPPEAESLIDELVVLAPAPCPAWFARAGGQRRALRGERGITRAGGIAASTT